VRSAARDAARRGEWGAFGTAFLGGGRPNLAEAVDGLAAEGASRFVVIPYFLTLGLHLERDLPALIEDLKRSHPSCEFDVTPPLDGHPALLDALLDRAREAACRHD
jgi:sirohydrochlorin ferrochelatase